MLRKIIHKFQRKISRIFKPDPDSFLKEVKGVIHIGANQGQEREQYSNFGLSVIWIEPIEEVFEILKKNLQPHEKQRALNYLVTDVDGQIYDFNVASNGGASSSILKFEKHGDIWPEVSFTRTVQIKSITLHSLVEEEKLDLSEFDCLILDTQGSELLILEGSREILSYFSFIKVEVPDFQSYRDCCTIDQLSKFMVDLGFTERKRHLMASNGKNENYYDIVYQNRQRLTHKQ